jgi:hypothetical protein
LAHFLSGSSILTKRVYRHPKSGEVRLDCSGKHHGLHKLCAVATGHQPFQTYRSDLYGTRM